SLTVPTGTESYAVAFSPDGQELAVTTDDGRTTLWDVSNRQKPVAGPTLWPGTSAAGASLAVKSIFSADGRFLAGAVSGGMFGDGEIKIAAINPPGLRASTVTDSSAMAIDFSPDGRAVVAGSWRCGKITYCRD